MNTEKAVDVIFDTCLYLHTMQNNLHMVCNKEDMAYQKWKPVVVILIINFIFAVANILLKAALSEGVNHLVIVTYRQTSAAMFLVPLACILERKREAKLTYTVLCYLFMSALLGATLTQYLFLMGLQFTSVAFSTAFVNMVPVCTFLLALLFRQEKLKMKMKSGKAKALGSVVCFGGVLLLALYKGFPLSKSEGSILNHNSNGATKSVRSCIVGSILYTSSIIAWSSWFLIQGWVCKLYPYKYSTTALLSSFSALQSAVLCLALNRDDITVWVLHGKLQISAVLFSGIVLSGLCYVGMAWCVEQKGPVFTAAFSPFMQIFVSIFDLTLLHEQIFFGSVLGSITVVVGLYILLWGKSKETTKQVVEVKPLETAHNNGINCSSNRPNSGFDGDSNHV